MQVGTGGELEPTDVAENKYSLIHGFRLLSSYQSDAGEKLWIITEADRSATTLLLPEEVIKALRKGSQSSMISAKKRR
jgi:hypothetical protein